MSFTKENENPLNRNDNVTIKIMQDNNAPYFSLNIKRRKTANSKYPKK
jgi:hypothetical protein